VTTYYLLHRHDFGMNDAPAGACILYALSCNLSESELADRYDLLLRTGGVESDDDTEGEDDAESEGDEPEGSGSTFKLKPWKQRRRPTLGIDPIAQQARQRQNEFRASGEPLFEDIGVAPVASGRLRVIPLIDSIHRLMQFWADGDVIKVNDYLDERGLRRSETFRQVLQALIELAGEGTEERAVLESLSNHVRALGERADSLLDKVRG
jgi:putative DNA methylase